MILIISVSALLITSITTAWAIYSNKQMEEMQEEMWDLQEELEELKPNPEEREKISFEIDMRTRKEKNNEQSRTIIL